MCRWLARSGKVLAGNVIFRRSGPMLVNDTSTVANLLLRRVTLSKPAGAAHESKAFSIRNVCREDPARIFNRFAELLRSYLCWIRAKWKIGIKETLHVLQTKIERYYFMLKNIWKCFLLTQELSIPKHFICYINDIIICIHVI